MERITGTKIGIAADRTESGEPAISGDGRYVVFQSQFEDLDFFDTNGKRDVFVYDRITGATRRVSTSFDGIEERFQDSINPSISGDGRFVAFESKIANFVESDTNVLVDIFVKDLLTGEMTLISSKPDGEQGNGDATTAALSEDGQVVAFISRATNLIPGDTRTGSKVFVASTAPALSSSLGTLAFLSVDLGDLNPSFSPNVLDYSIAVDSETEIAHIRAFAAEEGMTVQMQINNGGFNTVDSEPSALPLSVGSNLVEVKTTAADGSPGAQYTLTINRAASANAALASLGLATSEGVLTFSPEFEKTTTSYSATVPNASEVLTIYPSTDHPGATVKVNGNDVAPEDNRASIALAVGANTIDVEVTAEDLTTTLNYTLSINRSGSSDASLTSLTSSVEPITGILPFSPARTVYSMQVDNAVTSLTFTPVVRQAGAQINSNGEIVLSGSEVRVQNLLLGSNPITLLVTAEDGVTTTEYFVNVIRAESSAPISTISISLSNGTIILIYTGTLESSATADGPYSPVAGASSPYALAAQGGSMFFLVR